MTVVQVRLQVPKQPGLEAASGELLWQPSARHLAQGDPTNIVLPAPFTVAVVDGVADVTVEPSTLEWVWLVTESFYGVPDKRRAFNVPDTETIGYASLVEVDPLTLDPAALPDPVWYAYVDGLQTTAQDALVQATDARTAAEASELAAEAARDAAGDSESGAAASALAAQGSAEAANTSAGLAEAAKTSAAGAQASAAGFASAASGSADAAADSAAEAAASAGQAAGSATAAAEEADLAVAAKDQAIAVADGFTIGTVTTKAPGTSAEATITGELAERQLNLGIPQGATPQFGVALTTTGPETPGTPGLKGDKGDKGDPGGFTAATDLGLTDLNTILTAGLYRQTQGANVTTAKNYPITLNATAVMQVYMVSSSNVIQQFEFVLGNPARRLFWQRSTSDTGATWSSWVVFRSGRLDHTAGRAFYIWDETNNRDQLIYGDTGSRDVTTALLDATKWDGGQLKIRRVGWEVELRGLALNNNAAAVGDVTIFSVQLPSGFRNQHTLTGLANSSTGLQRAILAFTGTQLTISGVTSGYNSDFTLKWQTLDAWPTTLPGIADGTIPNL